MTIEILTEDESNISDVTTEHYTEIATFVRNAFKTGNEARSRQLDDIKKLRELIYTAHTSLIVYGQSFVLPDLYKLQDTYISHLMERVYFSNEALFDVKPLKKESIGTIYQQKISLVNDFDNMDFSAVIEDILEDNCLSGELIGFVSYKTHKVKRKVRRSELSPIVQGQTSPTTDNIFGVLKKLFPQAEQMLFDNNLIEGFKTKGGDIITSENLVKMTKSHCFYEVTLYEGTQVIPIKAEDYIFDTNTNSYEIWRSFKGINEILSNQSYTIDDETEEYLKKSITNPTSTELGDIDYKYDISATRDSIGNALQVFTLYGDITLSDGTELKNYVIDVCLDRVLRCEPSPLLFSPFVFYAPLVDPNDRRGISKLRVAIIYNAIRSNIANAETDLLALLINPPFWSVKGSITDTEIKLAPGKKLEFDAKDTELPPKTIQFPQGLMGFDYITFFDNLIDESTGIAKNLVGAVNQEGKTATEIEYSQAGAGMRIGHNADQVKRGFNLPLVGKVADVKAIIEQDPIDLVINKGDNHEVVTIDNVVRQGHYKYTLIDNKTANDRKAKYKEFLQFAQLFMQAPFANIEKVYEAGLSLLDFENPEEFINRDEFEQFINQATQQVPDEQKQQAKDQLKQMAVQFLQTQMQQPQPMQGGMPNAMQ